MSVISENNEEDKYSLRRIEEEFKQIMLAKPPVEAPAKKILEASHYPN